jgi:predicted nucleic acid-binding protein
MVKLPGREMICMKGKEKRQFIDTNILVYAHDSSAGIKNKMAKTIIAGLWESKRGCLSIQVLQEFYVTVTKKVAAPMKREDALRIISDLGNWATHSPDVNDVIEAVDIQQRYNVSFWDSLIICSAQKLGCDIIWSEDLNHEQQYGQVIIKNPFL